LLLAVVGLVGLVAWYACGLALDAQLMHRLREGPFLFILSAVLTTVVRKRRAVEVECLEEPDG
jgi:hypothetical protein